MTFKEGTTKTEKSEEGKEERGGEEEHVLRDLIFFPFFLFFPPLIG